ncbi:PD-(D/E)XK nuclease family protein [Agrilactobacillus yilanensis]|uniref:PD-(D/E)XK nuclease family protein n=1 Tax=Agrilactobacillus yilanensis TaxID=2485997 RepID=A0ABW4J9U3_9LACO|nr:PD-(D/E)XK nuclease family protein [Agrilactobacillus yilanensis]
MSLEFLYGTADKDHQKAIIDCLKADKKAASADQFFLIVPNHIKFESEVNLMTQLQKSQKTADYYATEKVQVFSFSRLAWFFLKDTQFYQKSRLDSAAQSMILTKIFQEVKTQLKVFRGELTQPGFTQALGKQLTELQNEKITPAQLSQSVAALATNSDTYLKAQDLSLIYDRYLTAVTQQFMSNDELLQQLKTALAAADLSQFHFYFQGFTQLTAIELEIVLTLVQNAKGVHFSLILDQPCLTQTLVATDLFFRSKKLQQQLVAGLQSLGLTYHNTLIPVSRIKPALKTVGDYWLKPDTKITCAPALTLTVADNPYQELEQVALTIHQLVTDQGYHYQDFLILTKHLADYETVLKPIFEQFELPYFNDLQIPMQDHPLLAFLTSLFAVDQNNFRYTDIMRLLKTELLVKVDSEVFTKAAFRQMLDITDNYLLAHNLYRKDWLSETPWQYVIKNFDATATEVQVDSVKTQAIETIHQLVRTQLAPFYQQLAQVQTAEAGATLVYQFLKTAGVLDQLVIWQNETAQTAATVGIVDKNTQGFNVFIQLLEQYVAILGTAPFDAKVFIELITAAFTNTAYAQIPATLDAVNVSEVGMVQMNNRKITFFIGLTDQNLPEVTTAPTILNDEDRTQLQAVDPAFEPLQTAAAVMANERFLAYTAFLNPTEHLYLSYAKTNSDGQNKQVSPYFAQLQKHFKLSPKVVSSRLPITEDIAELRPLIGTRRQMIRQLVPVLRQAKDTATPMGTPLTFIYEKLLNEPPFANLAQKVFASLQYHNQPQQLKPKVVDLLFGQTLRASVSQLETYYENPYAYFLTYGLHLKEREIYDLTPASRGSFYHEVMDAFIKYVVTQKLDLAKLSSEQMDQILDQVLTEVYQLPQYDIFSSTGRMHFIRYRLKEVLKLSIKNNIIQGTKMAFRPYRTEIPFGTGKNGLKGLHYQIDSQHDIQLRGKIDRIDVADLATTRLFNIIDYKSSERDFDYQQIYHGLSLQMLTYLQSVLDNLAPLGLSDAQFAGAYYYHLQNPSVPLEALKGAINDENIEAQVLKAFRYQGISRNDETVLEQLNTDVVQLRRNKNGAVNASDLAKVPNQGQLAQLSAYNTYKIKAAAQAIFAGALPLKPVQFNKQRTALDYSPYQAIFEFDPMLPENNYQLLQPAPKDKLTGWLAMMAAVLQQSNL